MSKLIFPFLAVFAVAAHAQQAGAPSFSDHFAKTPSQLSAISPTGGAGGSGNAKVQVVTLLGDPSKPGPYSQLLRVAPHASIPAHHHAGDRVGTVLSGTWHFGYGAKFDASQLKTLPTGSIYTEPANGAHFAQTGDEAVTVLITGFGPTDTVYEDPADDPAIKH
ncbi:cupin domain-containing protein [Dyella sp. BiH032]|uniref:cupin domain-containing protein n=1 Tax=Dyella sp. BiH032 TaxID=3075430 RepID=UPI002892D55D|nr:cupin domain-containing protein [Dyella sp. BiH032]WNL44251.1 cupin domain-containing protein [Dyella sp. BiH032]